MGLTNHLLTGMILQVYTREERLEAEVVTPLQEENHLNPNHHDFSFDALIFRGCNLWFWGNSGDPNFNSSSRIGKYESFFLVTRKKIALPSRGSLERVPLTAKIPSVASFKKAMAMNWMMFSLSEKHTWKNSLVMTQPWPTFGMVSSRDPNSRGYLDVPGS